MRIVCDEAVLDAWRAFDCPEAGELRLLPSTHITAESIVGADALIVRSTVRVDAALLRLHRPSFIGTATVGVDHVDESLLRDRGIAFASAAGSSASSVAQFTLGVCALLTDAMGRELGSMRLGVVGCGAIGERVARAGSLLFADVVRIDPPLKEKDPGGPFKAPESLADCDVISLHTPLTQDGPHPTLGLVDASWLRRLKTDCILINTGRGRVIEENALLKALERGQLGAAALDVFPREPDFSAELVKAVTLATPHVAGRSQEGMLANTRAVEKALRAHFGLPPRDEEPLTPPAADASLPLPHETPAALVRRAWNLRRFHEALLEAASFSAEDRARVFRDLRRPPHRRDLTTLFGLPEKEHAQSTFLEAVHSTTNPL